MATDTTGYISMTEPATLTFPNLDKAKAVTVKGKPSGEPKFSSNFEFELDANDLKRLKAHAMAVAKAKWPSRDIPADIKERNFTMPFTLGDKLADKAKNNGKDREFSRGKMVLTSRSLFPPELSVIEGGKIVDYKDDARATVTRKFYSGVQSLAEFNFVAYDGVGQNPDGVTAYLNKVCSLNKGEKLTGAGQSAAETFKGYIGLNSDESFSDDEIPF